MNASCVRISRSKYSEEKKAMGKSLIEYLHYWLRLDLVSSQLLFISCCWKYGMKIFDFLLTTLTINGQLPLLTFY